MGGLSKNECHVKTGADTVLPKVVEYLDSKKMQSEVAENDNIISSNSFDDYSSSGSDDSEEGEYASSDEAGSDEE